MKSLRDSGQPNPEFALASYKRLAHQYDSTCRLIDPARHKTIELLALSKGETVIDIASGTGLSLPALSQAVGPQGRVIAVELCPDMAAIAQHRIELNHLDNVTQIVASMETANIDISADALLFHYTHDVLRSSAAIERIFRSTKPGARIAIAGFKLPMDWRRVFNPWHRYRARGYLSTFEGYTHRGTVCCLTSMIFRFMKRFLSAAVISRPHGPVVQLRFPITIADLVTRYPLIRVIDIRKASTAA